MRLICTQRLFCLYISNAGPRGAVGSASDSRARGSGFDIRSGHILVSPSADSRRAVVSYWRKRKSVHEVLVNCLGDPSLPRKRAIRLTSQHDHIAVYRGRKTMTQQQQPKTGIWSKKGQYIHRLRVFMY